MSELGYHNIEPLIPGYALDSLEPEEAAQVESHLATCPWCSNLLQQHQRVTAALAQGLPQVAPAPAIKERLLRSLELGSSIPASALRWRFFSTRMVGTVAASFVVLLLAGLLALEIRNLDRIDNLNQENRELSSQLSQMSASSAEMSQELGQLRTENSSLAAQVSQISQEDNRLLTLVSQPSTARAEQAPALASQPAPAASDMEEAFDAYRTLFYMIASQAQGSLPLEGAPSWRDAHGVLNIAGNGDVGILVVSGLQSLPPDKAYQVWLWKDGRPFSSGLFSVDDKGWGFAVLRAREPIANHSWIRITPEPADGSDAPTSPAVLLARMNRR